MSPNLKTPSDKVRTIIVCIIVVFLIFQFVGIIMGLLRLVLFLTPILLLILGVLYIVLRSGRK